MRSYFFVFFNNTFLSHLAFFQGSAGVPCGAKDWTQTFWYKHALQPFEILFPMILWQHRNKDDVFAIYSLAFPFHVGQ